MMWSADLEGFVLFLVRRRGLESGSAAALLSYIERRGFELLCSRFFSRGDRAHHLPQLANFSWLGDCSRFAPEEIAGAVAAFNPRPRPPFPRQSRALAGVADAFVADALVPQFLCAGIPEKELACSLLATPDSRRAWAVAGTLMQDELGSIEAAIDRIRNLWRTPEPVIRDLTGFGRRAKVELIDYQGQWAVRKTFRPSQRRFLEREVFARKHLDSIKAMPGLLAHGENWLITPYYADVLCLRTNDGLLPLRFVKEAFAASRAICQAGYLLLDFTPANILVDKREGLKLIDLEFLQPVDQQSPSLPARYGLGGVPPAFRGDLPIGPVPSYERDWQPRVGLSLQSLLDDSLPVQHLRRTVFRLAGLRRRLACGVRVPRKSAGALEASLPHRSA